MNVMDWSAYEERYQIELEYSVLWEAALGVAVVTRPDLHHALTTPRAYWRQVEERLPAFLKKELEVVQQHQTWKGLLFLLDRGRFTQLDEWLADLDGLTEEELRFRLLPYLGEEREYIRHEAARGDQKSAERLAAHCEGHAFYPAYIRYVTYENGERLKRHLMEVLTGWIRHIVEPEEERIRKVLARDVHYREEMRGRLSPEAFVHWVTDGIPVIPAPGVKRVLLIPQIVYRPWRIQADDRDTRIVYYPVDDESLAESRDPDRPRSLWIQVHKALADEKRLRILRAIRQGVDTLPTLSKELGLPKTTMHHHLTLLRSARLLTMTGNRYLIQPYTWTVCQEELEQYLGMGPSDVS